jgi:ketosteroid isomerase-like protein
MATTMAIKRYADPDAAEEAFYTAFREGDIETMRRVWSVAGDVVCVHPAHAALTGYAEVMASWESILSTTDGFDIRFRCHQQLRDGRLVVHIGIEEITSAEGDRVTVPATNAYRLTADGWQLCLHHASPVQVTADAGPLH